MSEQDNKGQNQPADNESGAEQTDAGTSRQRGPDKQEPGNASGTGPEQSGEGTGAKAGEYS